MIKLLAIDLDGTLLNSFHEISNENKQAITRAQKHGIKVIIATGRPEQLCKTIVNQLGINDDIIMSNGGVIGHPYKLDTIMSKTLNESIMRSVIEYCEENNIIYLIYTKDAIISKPNFRVDFFENRNQHLPENERVIMKNLDEFDNIYSLKPNKILIVEENRKKRNVAMEYFKMIEDASIVQSQTTFIDVNPKNVTKGNALKEYAEYLGINQSEVAAIGDQANDLAMLEYAGTAIAMENAIPECLEIATHITLSNNNHGVAYAINHFILEGQN